ncbi:MAG: MurR/RpiR family transcriptional regulator, partial [Clostridium sp.]|nr:MurR/RpiR family transcriptional regulator [Clostridium sp.]
MEKEIILRITHAKVKFTYVEEQIAEYFLSNREPRSINELSKLLCVSPASITRFCKKIGLNNYKELMYLYSEHLKENNGIRSNKISSDLQNSYFKIFNNIDTNFDRDKIEKICEAIHNNRFMHIFALGLSATAAQDFKFRFSRMGKLVEVIYDKEAIEMASTLIKEDDLVFIFTL